MARKPSRRGNVYNVDFTGVDIEGGGGSFHIPEGDYRMAVQSVDHGTSQAGNEQFEWKFDGMEGKAKGKTFYFYTTMTPNSLWKLGQSLAALGFEVPDGPMEIDLDELVGSECIGSVEDNEYQGKINSKLVAIKSADGEDKPSSSKENGADKVEASEVEQMAEEELADLIKEHKLKVNLRAEKTLRRKAKAVVEALDEAGLLA